MSYNLHKTGNTSTNLPLSEYQRAFQSIGCKRVLTEADIGWWKTRPFSETLEDMKAYYNLAKDCKGSEFQNNLCMPGLCPPKIPTRSKQECPKNNSKGICYIPRKRAETNNEKFWNNCVSDNDGAWNDMNTLNQWCKNDFGAGSYYLDYRERRDCGKGQSKGMCKTVPSIDAVCPPGTIERLGRCYQNCPEQGFTSTDLTCTKNTVLPSCPPGKQWYAGLCYTVEPGKEIKSPGIIGPICPQGSTWNGTSCYYDRGAGQIGDRCDPGSEEYAGACYKANYDKSKCKRTAVCTIECTQ